MVTIFSGIELKMTDFQKIIMPLNTQRAVNVTTACRVCNHKRAVFITAYIFVKSVNLYGH